MVRLEHVNLVMRNIKPTLEFLLTAFPTWHIRGEGDMAWGDPQQGKSRHWVHVGDADYYITLNDGGEGENRDIKGIQTGVAHLGFIIEDLESLIQRLKQKGFSVDIIGKNHPFRKTVYYKDPAGFQFEFLEYLSDQPEEKNMYGGESGELIRK